MYWPCGVPQIYAHPRIAQATPEANNGGQSLSTESEGINIRGHERAEDVVDIATTRSDHLFASVTATTLDIWSTRPTVALASFERSQRSVESYGENINVLFKPDSTIVAIRTSGGYILTFAIETDPSHRVLQQHHEHTQSRRQGVLKLHGVDESYGLAELLLHFRRVIKIDAGISNVIAQDQELIVATIKPAAVQCIRWEPPSDGPQAVAQVLSKLGWMQKGPVSYMAHDRAMNLLVWIDTHGSAYAVQRARPVPTRNPSSDELSHAPKSPGLKSRLFDGYCFHKTEDGKATSAAINARFSLLAIALSSGSVLCYSVKDYVGNVPLSHTLQISASSSAAGNIVSMGWSPDGYCLFVAYERGWATWSVFGREGASSFGSNPEHAQTNDDKWLLQVKSARWISNGAEILLTTGDESIYKLQFSRSAAVGCFSSANLVRALLQTSNEVQMYKGHELPDLTSISSETSLWHHAQFPAAYHNNNWPVKTCVISQDGRYVAIAGRRGLAHYSVNSGRWKTFSDPAVEAAFAVRGGMSWFGHLLAVATESASGYDLRLYSRELDLGRQPLHAESFAMPIVFVGPSGEDSLLVYTYENILYHYVIDYSDRKARLMQVGQIAFHGVVRAPSRVRSVSWVVPESQLRNGDPARDVEFATVLFLVDDKLVLLQPSRTPEDDLKYDLRVVAQQVEYYILMRDQLYFNFAGPEESAPATPSPGNMLSGLKRQAPFTLRDSLWITSGKSLRLWPDVREVLRHAVDGDLDAVSLVTIPLDFYPLSILLTKGVVLGIEAEFKQRRDVDFSQLRTEIRTQLFLPYMLRHQLLVSNDTAAAFASVNQFQHLSYFPHALEILLHHVLDDEHERKQKGRPVPDPEPLPAILSFLQLVLPSTTYLGTLVSCVRKTEVTFWPTLFEHLPPPLQLFEDALQLEDLKTASGFLIILQGLEDEQDDHSEMFDVRQFEKHVVRLMSLARQKEDFELCAELARFMMGIDPRGDALRRVVTKVGFRQNSTHLEPGSAGGSVGVAKRNLNAGLGLSLVDRTRRGDSAASSPRSTSTAAEGYKSPVGGGDYFSASPGGY
jgi:RAB6A-GEF complex partner protein 1